MKAKLTKKEEIAEGSMYFEFGLEEGEVKFAAGQFFRLTLLNPPYSDNRGNSRFLGFVNTPSRSGVAASVTRKGPSAFKRYLAEAEPGIEAEIDGVDGKMTLPEDASIPAVFITGGIGIAPIMSLVRWMKEMSLPNKMTLVYSNTNRARTMFLPELSEYAQQNPNFVFVPTMTQDEAWGGETERIDQQFLEEKLVTDDRSHYYVTGTPRFVPAMVRYLRVMGINPANMKFEIFTGY